MRSGKLRVPAGSDVARIRWLAKPHGTAERSKRGHAGSALKKRLILPKRVIDADAAWGSSKLANCKEEFIPEYTWLYGLADANGNFEIGDLRVIHGKVAAIRPHFTLDTLRQVFDDFHRHGLLYIWEEHGKKYGHWTGSNKPGRLPPKSQRNHYPKLDVTTPTDEAVEKYWNSLAAIPDSLSLFPKSLPVHMEVHMESETAGKKYPHQAASNEQTLLPACSHCGKPLHEIIPIDAFADYRKMRNRKRQPLTDAAVDLIHRELLAMHVAGEDIREVLEQSIKNGWTGLFAVKNTNGSREIQYLPPAPSIKKRDPGTQRAIESMGKAFLKNS